MHLEWLYRANEWRQEVRSKEKGESCKEWFKGLYFKSKIIYNMGIRVAQGSASRNKREINFMKHKGVQPTSKIMINKDQLPRNIGDTARTLDIKIKGCPTERKYCKATKGPPQRIIRPTCALPACTEMSLYRMTTSRTTKLVPRDK